MGIKWSSRHKRLTLIWILPILPILQNFNPSSVLNSDILSEKLVGVKYLKRGRKNLKPSLPVVHQRFFFLVLLQFTNIFKHGKLNKTLLCQLKCLYTIVILAVALKSASPTLPLHHLTQETWRFSFPQLFTHCCGVFYSFFHFLSCTVHWFCVISELFLWCSIHSFHGVLVALLEIRSFLECYA